MKTNLLKQGAFSENCTETVPRKKMRVRAIDWEQAKGELAREPNLIPKESHLESLKSKVAGHPFLKGMKPEHLAILVRHAREVEFTRNQTILHENGHAHQFYLILQGRVTLESYVARADDIPLQIITAGDVLGWSWLFPPFVWHFQARALEPTKAIYLDSANLIQACEQDREFGYQFMARIAQVVIERLKVAQMRLLEIQMTADTLSVVDEPRPREVSSQSGGQSLEAMVVNHPFFTGMKPEHLSIILDEAMKTTFDPGQVIFREGDPANRFYLIQRGKVALESVGKETPGTPFQIISDGEVLGWSWLFPPFYSHFGARALESTESIFLYATRLREACEQNHEFGYELMKRTVALVIQRLQATRARLVDI